VKCLFLTWWMTSVRGDAPPLSTVGNRTHVRNNQFELPGQAQGIEQKTHRPPRDSHHPAA
jgi:hypothetical protein